MHASVCVLVLCGVPAYAERGLVHRSQVTDTLEVVVGEIPPLVNLEADGTVSGFTVDLVHAVAAELGRPVEFTASRSMDELLGTVERAEADFAAAGITITEPREARVDFSHATMHSGLRIAVRGSGEAPSQIWTAVQSLLSWSMLKLFGILLAFLLLAGVLLWFSDLGSKNIPEDFRTGVPTASWLAWACMTTIGFGDVTPGKWIGKLITIPVFFVGVVVVSVISGQVTSALTMQKIEASSALIQDADDLRRRSVATVEGTTSVQALDARGAKVRAVSTIGEAFVQLERGQVDAVVYDAPVLLAHVSGPGAGHVVLVGDMFEKQDYGFAFPPGSALRELVNRALLKLQSNGTYDRLYRKHFGI